MASQPSISSAATQPPDLATVPMLVGRGRLAYRAHLRCAALLEGSDARSSGSCPRRVQSVVASRRWRPGLHARRRCAGAGTERVARAAARPHPDCASSPGAPGRKSHWLGTLDPSAEASAAGAAGYCSLQSPGRKTAVQRPPLLPGDGGQFSLLAVREHQGSSVSWGLESGFPRTRVWRNGRSHEVMSSCFICASHSKWGFPNPSGLSFTCKMG